MRLAIRLGSLATLVALAGGLASSAYTRDAARLVSYACPGGEQFTVEYLQDHVRLRTGSGTFALSREPAGPGARFSDGHTVLRTQAREAMLERPGLPTASGCVSRNAPL